MSDKHWQLQRSSDGYAWLMLDRFDRDINALSSEVLEGLDEQLTSLERQPARGLVIASAKANGFIAGADVEQFRGLDDEETALDLILHGQDLMERIENLPFPTLALIHGFALGGGLELALACNYRIAEQQSRLGLPEVKLGIHPGFGGTLRLPQLIGHLPALELMLSGRSLSAKAARRIGLVDQVVPQRQLHDAAEQLIRRPPKQHRPVWHKRMMGTYLLRHLIEPILMRRVKQRVRADHYPAPFALLKLWRRYGAEKRQATAEALSVARLICGETAQSLVRVFFLQEKFKRQGDKSLFKGRHIHVVGAGVMGGDIAAWSALQGFRVTLQDRDAAVLARAVKRAHDLFNKRLKQPLAVTAAMDRLIPDLRGEGVAHADLFIEAIIEDAAAKQGLFRELETRAKRNAIFATNTSSIPLEVLADGMSHPERLVGIHFFNPVAKMQLVEVVVGERSGRDAVKKACAYVRRIERLPLPVKSSPGFLVNRVLMPYLLEAVALVERGVPAARIDRAALEFGMPMGPIRLADTVGLDICLAVAGVLSEPLNLAVPTLLRERVAEGRLGVKSGNGFYRYRNGQPVVKGQVDGSGLTRREITERLIGRITNEAQACLRDGIVSEADLVDAGIVFGTGFAPFRGGPLNFLRNRPEPDEVTPRHGVVVSGGV
ncbi:crotonase [Solemya pervernicosa gill symbiont]|uniref:enoyl-CoA hydratase n=1 Tax=Solemya pervernicosa gill symbiont TaxID=642797 RepID=A0A1T2L040_9GAMM|nr:3-hydroxyacyl-CoA dehydrogenase NAD-binding domain-containing protein [Solemya pervernicosa gill symbiont]OOZ38380.1 crotonase [Solemya pervernicosa gill symbiont]